MVQNYNYQHTLLWSTLALCFLLMGTQSATAQDPRFSQIHASGVFINPAMTGLYNGQSRLSFNYRDQWSSFLGQVPFRTFGAAYDYRFYAGRNDYFSAGLSVLQDEAGDAQMSMSNIGLNASYMKQLSGGRGRSSVQYLVAGARLALAQNSINWATLRFSTQFDGNAFDPTLSTGEDMTNMNNMYADFNAGLMWYMVMDDNQSIYLGAAMHHINQPNISLLDNLSETLYSTIQLHAGGEFPITSDISLLPMARYMMQGPSYEIDFGSSIRFTTNDFRDIALRAGVLGRIVNGENAIGSDAVTVLAGLEWDRWALGLSYDLTISDLSATNDGRGAFEISLMYTHPAPRRRGMYCPTF